MDWLKKIIVLSLIWFGVWYVFYFYLEPQNIDYIDNYIFTCLYFLVVIVTITTIFRNQIGEYVEKFSPKDLLMMVIFSMCISAIYYFTNMVAENSPMYAIKSQLNPMLYLDSRYLATKAFEIMFQQTFFMVTIYYLFTNKISKRVDIFLFGLYILILHIPRLFVNEKMGKTLVIVSFFAGLLFSYFITKSIKGFIYSYMIHFGFYVLVAIIFWLGGANYILSLN